jgi:hypothetical protein
MNLYKYPTLTLKQGLAAVLSLFLQTIKTEEWLTW